MKLLYVTWDGPGQNYLDSLFFPLFARLRTAFDVETHVLQFSWDVDRFRSETLRSAARWGVGYEVHEVPRRPLQLATGLAITTGAFQLARAARRFAPDVVMPRSHIPGAMALLATPALGASKLVWDSDGLMPDERLDFGGWRRGGANHRLFTAIEQGLLRRSARVLTRTDRAKAVFVERAPSLDPLHVHAVPNGKDDSLFRPATDAERAERRRSLGLNPETPLLIYVGSIGPQYRPEAMAKVFAAVHRRRSDAHFLILSGASEPVTRALTSERVPSTAWTARRVPAEEVPHWVRAADAGLSFREPSLSMRAVCPLKVAEYLLSGVPVLANAGVGDLDVQLAQSEAGAIVPDFEPASLESLASALTERILPRRTQFRDEARRLGLAQFSLATSAAGYHQAMVEAVRDSSPRPHVSKRSVHGGS